MLSRCFLLALVLATGCRHAADRESSVPRQVRPASEQFLFEAEPASISPGETSILRWNIPGATSVAIEETSRTGKLHLLGKFPGSGTLSVQPRSDAIYVISCEGSPEISCASLTVRVHLKKP